MSVAILPVTLGVVPVPGVVADAPLTVELTAAPAGAVVVELLPAGRVALAGSVSLLKNISRLLCNC